MSKIFFLISALFSIGAFANTVKPDSFPSEKIRVAVFDKFISEVERLDAEGLPARKNRPESWKATVGKLREQARLAADPISFGQVFRKLDMTYPNLHAQVSLDEKYDLEFNRSRPTIAVRFGPKNVDRGAKNRTYLISSIDTAMVKDFRESMRPALGDELIAINNRPIAEWSRENFIYCKFPMREQCEANFFDSFRREFLSWDRRQSLDYTLKRNGRVWNTSIPFEVPKQQTESKTSNNSDGTPKEPECPVEPERYDGFAPSYKGLNICAFESAKHPGTVVLRLASFAYRELPGEEKIQSLKDEVDRFFDQYWKEKRNLTKKLIIDLIDNEGGDTPVEWYAIFYEKPFQEEYVQFKKLPELDDPTIRKNLFYDDGGKEIWFSDLMNTGKYQKIKTGSFLPRTPQFCVSENETCDKGLFPVRTDGFKGQVRLLVNEWCISSCTGFVWSMKGHFGSKGKVVGIPDSGDSAYARLFLDVYLDSSEPEGFRTIVSGRKGGSRQRLPPDAIIRQQVAVTRSTDAKGNVISATPTHVDIWVGYERPEFVDSWEIRAFKEALKN